MSGTDDLKTMTTAQIKVGDVLIREGDHLGRPDDKVTVAEIRILGKREFRLTGYWSPHFQRASSLSAENYRIIERHGERIGKFFVKYW